MNDAFSDFRDAIRNAGLEPPDVIRLGKLHRFPGVGKRPSNRAGWCLLFGDGLAGCFGDWSTDLSEIWQAKQEKHFSDSERAALARRVKTMKQQTESALRARQSHAANRALAIWRAAPAAPEDHPYLIRKGIQRHNARTHRGTLVLAITDFYGELASLQFIAADGSKRLLSRGRKRGCFIRVTGDLIRPSRVVICEGWATGCTLAQSEPTALVLAAIDAGNLEPVAMTARRHWPAAELVIAGDDDRLTPGNPGVTKAKAAAIASGAALILPRWPDDAPQHLTDFNDLARFLDQRSGP